MCSIGEVEGLVAGVKLCDTAMVWITTQVGVQLVDGSAN